MTKKTKRLTKQLCLVKGCSNEMFVAKHGLCRCHANHFYAGRPLGKIKKNKRYESVKAKLEKIGG